MKLICTLSKPAYVQKTMKELCERKDISLVQILDNSEVKAESPGTVPGVPAANTASLKLPSTEDVWNYVYNHHEFCEDFARENEARDISKLVYEFIYRQLQA
jgi:hypothetical protein